MKLIIAGGRDNILSWLDQLALDNIRLMHGVTEIVSGGARGVDRCGEKWAKNVGLPVKVFPADWDNWGKPAGPIRNQQMVDYADALAVFPGNRGTNDVTEKAEAKGLQIFDMR